ncbi:BrnT family toxin [Pseudomonas sp. CM25]|uniref:BrnT family toxin n=1 Tax=unclassified Pseudomonas TaxID=196821 RepID=UPI00155487D6|nr:MULTISPECIES: BrnT family toxin [unclassified Pseudomonas]NQD56622.1 BrnT family toxin [Pseudomonas sp. CM25]NQD74081.1 BrnT family toxin [Pseudomonas sp. CM27]HEN8801284.1 BrnT family toxin [Pseudomonas putida]
MFFEWDDAKNHINIRKHGIDFSDVPEMFNHPMLIRRDDNPGLGEERWVCLGWLKCLIGVVVYTERRGDVIRIISARKATRWEATHYDQNIEN